MNKDFKPVIAILSIIIPIILIIYVFNFNVLLKEDTIKWYARDYFENVRVQVDKGHMIISCESDNQTEALDNIRRMYYGLSKKPKFTHIEKLSISIRHKNGTLSTSISINNLKDIDWKTINSYEELIKKANVK